MHMSASRPLWPSDETVVCGGTDEVASEPDRVTTRSAPGRLAGPTEGVLAPYVQLLKQT